MQHNHSIGNANGKPEVAAEKLRREPPINRQALAAGQGGPEIDYALIRQRPARNGTPRSTAIAPAPAVAPAADAASGASPPAQAGAEIILAYFRERYRPVFRVGAAVHTADGDMVPMSVACGAPDFALITQLEGAADAPRYPNGNPKRDRLPAFFRTWASVAWGELHTQLPDEDAAALGADTPTAETFRRLVRDVMLSEIVLGDVIGNVGVTQTERRSLIDWCEKFAKPGPWRSIRSKRCWCRTFSPTPGEIVLRVAIRVELFGQVRADKRLCVMTQNTFSRRAERYGVGGSQRRERPGGKAAVVLADEFVSALTEGLHDTEADAGNLAHKDLPRDAERGGQKSDPTGSP